MTEGHSSELPVPPAQASGLNQASQESHEFRWQALFQSAGEPVFVLNRKRRILFVNRAWEKLTGLSATEARGLVCRRRSPGPQDPWDLVIRALCCPPPEVLRGSPSRTRRLVPRVDSSAHLWDVDFFPLHDDKGLLCVVGKITALQSRPVQSVPLPDKVLALRQTIRQRYGLDQLASHHSALHRVVEQVRLASQIPAPVLILGEPGTGKHWLARALHHHSLRKEGMFAALDCEHLPAGAIEKVLFGDNSLLQPAGGGTLYLREPSHLPLPLQLRLCHLLTETGESSPVVLAGCHADPQDEVRSGRLLEELYYGLSTLVIKLPPLRERITDLPMLVETLLERACWGSEHKVKSLTPQAWETIRTYSWPGNLRELYAVLQNASLRTKADSIDICHLPARLCLAVKLDQTPKGSPERSLPLDRLLEEAERRLIRLALRKAQGNRSRAAELLSIWRPRLLRRMEALGIKEW